jgi:hypothetical protein
MGPLCTAFSSARHLQRRSTSSDMRDLCWWRTEFGEKWPVNLACDSDFHINRRVLLHAANLRHGTDGFTSPPKEGMLWTFIAWKIRQLRTRDLGYKRPALIKGAGSDVHKRRYRPELRSIASEMSINFLSLSLGGLPLRLASNTEPVSRNFSVSQRIALRWGTGVSGNFSQQIAPALNRCIYYVLERRIQQEKHVPQLKKYSE